ncbi:zinc finger, CCHC-type containing protein [Tanacetum coccineum]
MIYYHSTRDREQHLTWELFSYKKDSNEASFAVAAVDKIYAHESLTFNNTVACEVISKWKADLKDDMDARSDVYVLSNGCKKCSDDSDGYYWEYTPGMFIHICLYIDDMVFSCGCKAENWATKGFLEKANGNVLGMKIVRDQSGNTLRVSQFRFYNEKLVQTLLERHFILSLEGSLSGDCDVEKNGKWSCIYTVRSQEYQVVCMRLDIAFADVGMLDKFDRGLQTNGTTGHFDRDCKEGKSDSAEVMHRDTTRKCHDTTRKCHLCGYTGHYARDCKGKKLDSKELVLQDTTGKCNVCGKTGHYARECKDKKSNTVKVVFKEIIGSGIRSSKKAQGWYLFFGSSAHVCYSRDMFVDYTPMINHKVILDNKDHVDVVRTGTVVLR